jgi:L-asparaginase
MKLSFASVLPAFAALASASPIKRVAYPGLAPRHLFTRQEFQAPINASLPNVTIFATGGTIASQGSSNTQTIGYRIGLGVEALVDAVPEILNISNIAGYQASNVGSPSINETWPTVSPRSWRRMRFLVLWSRMAPTLWRRRPSSCR